MYNLEKGDNMMFTYVKLTNFKSFGTVKFDFKNTKKNCKKFIAIYGENGSGKSNFVSAFELLLKTMTSIKDNRKIQKLRDLLEKDEDRVALLLEDLLEHDEFNELPQYLKKCRMIDSEGVSEVEYGFLVNGVEGYYKLSFDTEIVGEELYYLTNKQRGKLFSIKKQEEKIIKNFSASMFNDNKYEKTILELMDMYWGKHSLLAILYNEIQDKNITYIRDKLSNNLFRVIDNFTNVFILCKSSKRVQTGVISGSNFRVSDFEEIEVDIEDTEKTKQLKLIEKIMKEFYTQIYSDIVDVYYEPLVRRRKGSSSLRYRLVVEKVIAGQVRKIPFNMESAGTQSVLAVLRAIVEAVNGQTVIYDEIDTGIHDLLMKNILMSVQDEISGQLIITTHNTLLLESLNLKSAYIIYTDYDGNKDARCMADYGTRIQATNNARKLYLSGVFGGIPYVEEEIDYSQMHIDRADHNWEE
ncbi:MAG: ATP-binding protein [Clostridia bacterium]|nr:ATP-binding protein [Clostridia bacterium]